jgi:dTDP-glucose 4,6-dehydratase
VVDSLTYAGNFSSIEKFQKDFYFHQVDIRDLNSLKQIFREKEFDVVANFAAETHVDNSISNPEIFLETNIHGTFNLLECARIHDFKFLQVSTDEVYGSIMEGEFVESDNLDPSSPYSASKASAELLMQAYIKTYSIRALGVRCSNNYGHYQNAEKLIPSFISKIKHGEKVPVYGNGSNVREWIHVSDSVEGIIRVMQSGTLGEFYNISSSDFRTNLEVTRAIINFFGKNNDQIEYVADRLGHDFRYAINSEKIRKELNWKPRVDFEEGLQKTIQWYLENPAYLSRK